MNVVNLNVHDIKPYKNNPRNNDESVEQVANSIKEFGFKVPIIIDKNNEIVAGHTRYKAVKKLGIKTIPCIIADDLTDEQIKAFRLADNKVGELSTWNFDLLNSELDEIFDIDMSNFGFDNVITKSKHFWGDEEGEITEEYSEFEEKFKPKLTTDDCYTPNEVYEIVKNWCVDRYHLKDVKIIRPFYPGGDYKKEKYDDNSVVIDNPPFSILSEIVRFYLENNINFFMFAPALTLFSTAGGQCNYIDVNVPIIYENGASVATSFVTNLGEYKIETSPELYCKIKEANKKESIELPKYAYPSELICVQTANNLSKIGVNFKVKNAYFVRSLDQQEKNGIYGGGFLISKLQAEKLQAEKLQAEKPRTCFQLSEREKKIVQELGDE